MDTAQMNLDMDMNLVEATVLEEVFLTAVQSAPNPQPDQKHRSSRNFAIKPPAGYTGLRWECPEGVSFSVKQDIKWWLDQKIFELLTNGSHTKSVLQRASYYIADPSGSAAEFMVRIYATRQRR